MVRPFFSYGALWQLKQRSSKMGNTWLVKSMGSFGPGIADTSFAARTKLGSCPKLTGLYAKNEPGRNFGLGLGAGPDTTSSFDESDVFWLHQLMYWALSLPSGVNEGHPLELSQAGQLGLSISDRRLKAV